MIPNPGSKEALNLGCKCAVYDNNHGDGIGKDSNTGEELFWINLECPLHGKEQRSEKPKEPYCDPSLPEEVAEHLEWQRKYGKEQEK